MGNYKYNKGFSLIELMIVIAIVGVLSAVAIPGYKNYVLKGKIAKHIEFGDALKAELALILQTNDPAVLCNDINFVTIYNVGGIQGGYGRGTSYSHILPNQCAISILDYDFTPTEAFSINYYSNVDASGGVTWNCYFAYWEKGGADLPAPFLPSECQRI